MGVILGNNRLMVKEGQKNVNQKSLKYNRRKHKREISDDLLVSKPSDDNERDYTILFHKESAVERTKFFEFIYFMSKNYITLCLLTGLCSEIGIFRPITFSE